MTRTGHGGVLTGRATTMGANSILEELLVVENEIKGFIFGEVPKAQQHVITLLQAAALQLRCAQAKEGPTSDIDRSVIAFLESSDRTVVSSLKLSECHVSELDVNIRFPKYNKGAGQHFSIVPRSSYLLRQVTASSSGLEEADFGGIRFSRISLQLN